jgi:6-phosphogluconolactonase/glucosamine-6-phosphate isomerase/deaminase
MVKRILEGPRQPRELPAQLIAPARGHAQWLVDRAAAAELSKNA